MNVFWKYTLDKYRVGIGDYSRKYTKEHSNCIIIVNIYPDGILFLLFLQIHCLDNLE